MRKSLILSLSILAGCLALNSCDPWEDDSYHEGGGINTGHLVKEVHTTSEGVEGLATYTYDEQGRMTGLTSYTNILDMESYSQITQTYSGDTNIHTVSQTYMMGTIFSTITIDTSVNGNTVTMDMESEFMDQVITQNSVMSFSAPCGVQENTVTVTVPDTDPMEAVITYNYTDENCSYIESTNGDVSSTVTMDNQFSPFYSPQQMAMGIVSHNIVKNESADGTIETISYTYDADGYPTQAVHTFNEGSGQADYTEEFIYY